MLSPYDELFVHQTPETFAEVSSSDLGWDDGTYLGVYSAVHRCFLFAGMRVSPNSDMIGGYVGIAAGGRQRTVRFSRPWRSDMSTSIGPMHLEVVRPFEEVRLRVDECDAGLACDITWRASRPAHLEPRHRARRHGRLTTDQSRYSQGGSPTGWIDDDGERITVDPTDWSADRDHSWGLYAARSPLAPSSRWLPPVDELDGARRALRLWANLELGAAAGMFQIHEDEHGGRSGLNDTFATPFEGRMWRDGAPWIRFVDGRHRIDLVPGTRVVRRLEVELVDDDGHTWIQEYVPTAPPWTPAVIGYHRGSWSDGGSMFTYRDGPSVECDELEIDPQPFTLVMADGREHTGMIGNEYVCEVTMTDPDGNRSEPGIAHLECFLDGAYEPLRLT